VSALPIQELQHSNPQPQQQREHRICQTRNQDLRREASGAQLQSKQPRTRQEERNMMVANSEGFYQQSKSALKRAVNNVNDENEPRVFFATLPEVSNGIGLPTVDPLFAYGAPQKHEWMIPVRFYSFGRPTRTRNTGTDNPCARNM
jgi:hypothetical protein